MAVDDFGLRTIYRPAQAGCPACAEAFLADVFALAREDLDAIRERVALADCEEIFRAQETHKRMKDKAAHACCALCRARVAEELQRRRGTRIGEHWKLVLSIIDRQ